MVFEFFMRLPLLNLNDDLRCISRKISGIFIEYRPVFTKILSAISLFFNNSLNGAHYFILFFVAAVKNNYLVGTRWTRLFYIDFSWIDRACHELSRWPFPSQKWRRNLDLRRSPTRVLVASAKSAHPWRRRTTVALTTSSPAFWREVSPRAVPTRVATNSRPTAPAWTRRWLRWDWNLGIWTAVLYWKNERKRHSDWHFWIKKNWKYSSFSTFGLHARRKIPQEMLKSAPNWCGIALLSRQDHLSFPCGFPEYDVSTLVWLVQGL